MIRDIHFPEEMTGTELDEYLAKGWFRMGQTIFTTDFIPVSTNIYPVFWLRFILSEVKYGKKQMQLLQASKGFELTNHPFRLTKELEDLYALYRTPIDFDAPPTIESFLFGGEAGDIYDTRLLEVRDKGRLIAAGIFDNGAASIAGIMNFYDPAYKAKSLGKLLMLLKINDAIENNKVYYYPGYIAGGFRKFDYKLFPDSKAAEIFDSRRGQWIKHGSVILPGTISFDPEEEIP